MPREGAQHKNPLWLKLLAGSLAALVVVAAIVVMAPQFLQNPAADVVVIKADSTPLQGKAEGCGRYGYSASGYDRYGHAEQCIAAKGRAGTPAPARCRPRNAANTRRR